MFSKGSAVALAHAAGASAAPASAKYCGQRTARQPRLQAVDVHRFAEDIKFNRCKPSFSKACSYVAGQINALSILAVIFCERSIFIAQSHFPYCKLAVSLSRGAECYTGATQSFACRSCNQGASSCHSLTKGFPLEQLIFNHYKSTEV